MIFSVHCTVPIQVHMLIPIFKIKIRAWCAFSAKISGISPFLSPTWTGTGDPPKIVRKNCLFSWEFFDRDVRVSARSGLMPIFKPKMHVRRAFSAEI